MTYSRLSGKRAKYRDLFPCLNDQLSATPIRYYFFQDSWGFHNVLQHKPALHVDIGSTALLVGCLSAVVPTVSVDFRPVEASMRGLSSVRGSIVQLPFKNDVVESISSLCVIEHIGLGRYGDSVDPEGTVKAARELQRVLKRHGHVYISVPCGESRVVFNAHRIFTKEEVLQMFGRLRLVEFKIVGNRGFIEKLETADPSDFPVGLFHFTK